MNSRLRTIAFFAFILCVCFASSQSPAQDRSPSVAGTFYPADQKALRASLSDLFAHAAPLIIRGDVVALISPHAGFVYSGIVAASAFNQLDPNKEYANIFILASSHRLAFEGASVYCRGNFQMPLGTVTVNTTLARSLFAASPLFVDRPDAHEGEHSIEVTIPFLQFHLKKNFRIVPILLGTNDPVVCRKLADVLRPYLTPDNLFVVSTDFSHYPSYENALVLDRSMAEAVVSNSSSKLLASLQTDARNEVPNLATRMCAWPAVLTLVGMTEGNSRIAYHELLYKNSGDVSVGDRSRVVGYHAIAVTMEQEKQKAVFRLSSDEQKTLLNIARETLVLTLNGKSLSTAEPRELPPALKTPCGAFVTLKKNGELRGCIGRFDASLPLHKVVQEMAIAAGTQDTRFSPVRAEELSSLTIEVSVLTPMRRIQSIDEIILGTHGIYIKKGSRAGTFLPQVATETGWSKEEFLGHCAQDKAGIGWNGWKEAEIYVYEALIFGEDARSFR